MRISKLGSCLYRKGAAALPKLKRLFRMSIRRTNIEPAEDTNVVIDFIPEDELVEAPATPTTLEQDGVIQEEFPIAAGSLIKSLHGIPFE